MKRMIQKSFFFNVGLCLFFAFFFNFAQAKLDRIIAIVNDEVITQSEYDRRMEAMKMLGKTSKKEVIDSLIDDSIKLQLAKKVKFTVDDETLNKSIQGIAEGNHVTVDQLYSYIEQQGFSKESYREMIRKQITIARVMQQQFGGRVHLTKAEIEKFQAKLASEAKVANAGSEYDVRNILVPVSETAKPADIQAAKLKAQHIYEELKVGKSLEQIAADYPMVSQNNLGWRKPQELPELFLTHLQTMKPKDISQPFQAPNGFQILILNDKRVEPAAAQAISFKQAEQILYQKKLIEAYKPWMEKARKDSFIKILI